MISLRIQVSSATPIFWHSQAVLMTSYHRLALMEREEFSRLLAAGYSLFAACRYCGWLRVRCRANSAVTARTPWHVLHGNIGNIQNSGPTSIFVK
jgi:hypothetical protein